jgi:hypothetical protein
VRAERSTYAALEAMQALLDTHSPAQLVVFDFSAEVARAAIHVPGAGGDSGVMFQLQDFLEAFGCCTCDRSLRGSICAHHILALRHHCLPDASESEQRQFVLKAMHFLGTTFGAVDSCSSATGIRPFVDSLLQLRSQLGTQEYACIARAASDDVPAAAAAADEVPSEAPATPVRPVPPPSTPGPTPSQVWAQAGVLV